MIIFKDGLPTPMLTGIPVIGPYPGGEYYQITEGTNGHAVVTFYQMTNFTYSLEFFVYGYPTIEFWKPETQLHTQDPLSSPHIHAWDKFSTMISEKPIIISDLVEPIPTA